MTFVYAEAFAAAIGIVLCSTGSFTWWTAIMSAFLIAASVTTFLHVSAERPRR
jgi:hypothetical protein